MDGVEPVELVEPVEGVMVVIHFQEGAEYQEQGLMVP